MFRGFSKIFAFTFIQHIKTKGYKALTIVLAILCLLLPITIMGLVAYFGKEEVESDGGFENEEVIANLVENVFVVDLTDGEKADFSILNTIGEIGFTNIVYENCENIDDALEKAEQMKYALVAVVEYVSNQYDVRLIVPDSSFLGWDDAYNYDSFLYNYFQVVLVQKSGLDYTQLVELLKPVQSEMETGKEDMIPDDGVVDDGDSYEEDIAKQLFSMILPYMIIMVLYFMILFYGQGVATSIIMEKTSKLMDVFLVTVKPSAMIMGKILGIALAGIIQLFTWIICVVLGFVGGTALAKYIDPETDMEIIRLFESFGELSGMFSLGNIILCVFVVLAGFLLYCALSAVGGALAGKPEDLGSTNALFTMALVFSFLLTLNSGVLSQVNESTSSIAWQYYVPFTAIFIVPSETLLGNMSIFQTFLSLGCILITTVLIILFAGKIYSMLVLYKGNPPKLKTIIKMLRNKA